MTIAAHPSTEYNLSLNAGGKLLCMGQKISLDGNHYIAFFRHQIKVYYFATRQCIRSIPIDLSESVIIDSVILESDPNLIYIFDKTGEVTVVNWKDKSKQGIVETFQLSLFEHNALLKILLFDPITKEVLALSGKYSTSLLTSRSIHIIRTSTAENSTNNLLSVKNILIYKTSINNRNVALLNNNSEVIFLCIDENGEINSTQTIPFIFKSKITCLAVSNDSESVALGTNSGIIQLIYSNNLSKPQRLLKWHIDEVKSLEFNQDDTYLLSGGVEKVLVFWQLNTDRQQFLPRLNGVIENIEIDFDVSEFYSITLNLNDANDIELLVLSASDLISRLTVDGLRPNYNMNGNINKLKKKLDGTVSELKNDFTCNIAVHPVTNHLYLPNGSSVQVYDFKKDEQLFIQTAVSTTQVGKVKSEQQILDPKIEILTFTTDGKWMCTFDSVPAPQLDNLLSTKDVHYSLKFWKFIESPKDSKQSYWELSTKIIDPHGAKTPIVSIVGAPSSYHNGLAFLTADSKGGVRLWRPRIPKEIYNKISTTANEKLQQTAWILKKSFVGNGTFETNSVSFSWSNDASIILIGYENSLSMLDCNTFREVEDFHLPSLLGSRVRSVHLIDNNVVALAKNRIISYDLLNAKNNELCGRLQTPTNGKHLISVDTKNNLIALVVNYFNKAEINAKIMIFRPQSLKPVYIGHHSQYISSIVFAPAANCFVFVDLDSMTGVISSTKHDGLSEPEDLDYAYQLNMMLTGVQDQLQATNAAKTPAAGQNGYVVGHDDDSMDTDVAEEAVTLHGNTLNAHSFDKILENSENMQLESLFERVINIL